MENMGARYNIQNTLPAARFSNPPVAHTSQLPYEYHGNRPPRKGSSPNVFDGPIPVIDATQTIEGFQDYPGAPRTSEFDLGRHSNPEQIPSEKGPGTFEPAKTTLPEIGEETSALGDVAGLVEGLL